MFARGARHPILDGNVKRVLARLFGITGYPGDKRVADRLWQRAEELLPRRGVEAYTQGLMDLGAGVCARSRPRCEACPWSASCVARKRGLIAAIPGRKPRKALPQKATTMLALTRAGEVLLEKRPPAGIWGGMWCLARSRARYRNRRHTACSSFGASVIDIEKLPADRARLYALQAGYIPDQAEGRQAGCRMPRSRGSSGCRWRRRGRRRFRRR